MQFKTGKLPLNFIVLGIILLLIDVWRIMNYDWVGILLLCISLVFLLLRSGIIIDPAKGELKKYTGFFFMKFGSWENISSVKNLTISGLRVTQNMNVVTISRSETRVVYKLMMVLSGRTLELMTGEKELVFDAAEKISKEMKVHIINKTNVA